MIRSYAVYLKPEANGIRLYVDAGVGVNPAGDRFRKSESKRAWPNIKFLHDNADKAVEDARKLQCYLDSLKSVKDGE